MNTTIKKYLSIGLTLALIVVASVLFLQNRQTPTPKKEIAQRVAPLNYQGAMLIKEMDDIADIMAEIEENPPAGGATFDITTMARSITAEALKAFSNSTEHALPLVASWNVGEYEGMDPEYLLKQIEKGEHILVSWKLDPYYSDYIGRSYYESSIKKAASLNLPLVFILPAPESALTYDSYYRNFSTMWNANVVDTQNNILDKLSPFGPDVLWSEVGNKWSSSPLMAQIQEWYPNPPLVLFVSRDEAAKLSWSDVESSSRYKQAYPTPQSDAFKRTIIGGKWIEKYRLLKEGFKQGFVKTAWKSNVKFISHNKLPDNFGKVNNWQDNATTTIQYMNVWPLTSNAITVDFNLENLKSALTANSPQVLANNLPFMLNEAKAFKPDFAYQLSINDNEKTNTLPAYRGFTQFALWFLRPSTIRQASTFTDQTMLSPLFQEVVDSVELIHYNSVLADFWRNASLVNNGKSNFNKNIPAQYVNAPRWFLLDVDTNPLRQWATTDEVAVWAFALVKGKAPNREWLVYVQSPQGDMNDVTVTVPGYKDILVNSSVMGSFYVLRESDSLNIEQIKQNINKPNPKRLKIPNKINVNNIPASSIVWLDDYSGEKSPVKDAVKAFKDAVKRCNNSDTLNVIGIRGNYPIKSYAVGQTSGAIIKKDLTIIGETQVVFDIYNNLSIEAPLLLQTSIVQNVKRGDLTINLESVSNINIGDLFVIESDKVAERGWKYRANDISPITAIDYSLNTITLSEKPNFSYSAEEAIKVKIYKHIELTIQNISVNNKSEKHSLRFTGFSKINARNIQSLDADNIRQGSNGLLFTQSYALAFKDLKTDGGLYPFLILNSRNILVDGIISQNSRHPFDTAMFSSDIEVMNVVGKNNTATVECHPSFNVYWHDVKFTNDTQLTTVRAVGVKL
ncbi:hypothetical protein JHD49_10495, partial [Sulfurimonas sp. SAG-AH-194-C21]